MRNSSPTHPEEARSLRRGVTYFAAEPNCFRMLSDWRSMLAVERHLPAPSGPSRGPSPQTESFHMQDVKGVRRLSSLFLAASSLCFLMMASRAKSALACSVFPSRWSFM
ncbi:hypothetical protein EYF80_046584 [Liparis tanakae]|uniref:Uncharacterized protein n=1 Tax=Liparis tanakae TaxID=230148 RepID=A0A4Z2FPQ4_9TELE|nr:hypothetical protein EYF80_046584 [Liparis tanakae]